MAKMIKHTHRYRKIKSPNGKVMWRCMLPGCRHYLRPEFIVGQISNCYRCGKDFELNLRLMKLEVPHCGNCTHRRLPNQDLVKKVG